ERHVQGEVVIVDAAEDGDTGCFRHREVRPKGWHTLLGLYRVSCGRRSDLSGAGQCAIKVSSLARCIQATTNTPPTISRPAASRRRKSGSLKNILPPMIDSTNDSRWTATTSGAARNCSAYSLQTMNVISSPPRISKPSQWIPSACKRCRRRRTKGAKNSAESRVMVNPENTGVPCWTASRSKQELRLKNSAAP